MDDRLQTLDHEPKRSEDAAVVRGKPQTTDDGPQTPDSRLKTEAESDETPLVFAAN
jgi:hypothetical protein